MQKELLLGLAGAGLFLASVARANPYAGAVVSYNPGTNYAPGYTNISALLGPPSAADPYGAVDPFDPAYETNQILSIGAGGWVTVEFDQPVVHYPNTSRDFIIFGNSFFEVTNYDDAPGLWSTDGAVINDAGQTRVSVSRDGVTFYALDSALAPTVDSLYPTDGSGNFQLPVDPALEATNFAGLTLAQIRQLYNGSAGGASYNVAWARDGGGNPVSLPDIRFVRVDVLANSAQIAGFAAVDGTVVAESFSNNPALDGWQAFGATNLFSWNATNQDLEVTWDSSQPNSYFYHPLGTLLTSNDDFSLTFDLILNDATALAGTYQFELAIGLLNFAQATNGNFLRGSGENASNLVEFDYFPPDGFGDAPSVDATLLDSQGDYSFFYDDVPLPAGTPYHVTIHHPAGTGQLNGEALVGGQVYASLASHAQFYSDGTNDFRLDTVAVDSFSDADSGGSSVLAHGVIKNLFLTAPPPPVTYLGGALTNGNWAAHFWSRTNWNYALEKSPDLKTWSPVVSAVAGTGGFLILLDTNTLEQSQFYRVGASPQQ